VTETPHRSGFVAIVGPPNVGKSTLVNAIVGEKIAITTPKPQTTRDRIRGIWTEPGAQIVFIDTPGVHKARNRLNRAMVQTAIGTLSDVDLVYLMFDADRLADNPERAQQTHSLLLKTLSEGRTPAIALVNKVDRVKAKGALLPLIEVVSGLGHFEAIIPMSALRREGLDELLESTRPLIPKGPPLFPGDALTDRTLRFMAREIVREHLFMSLEQELPYQIAVSIDSWKEQGQKLVTIHGSIHVSRKSQKGIVIGKGGSRLKKVGAQAQRDLEALLETKVYLDLHVRVEEGWIDRADGLRKLGYDDI